LPNDVDPDDFVRFAFAQALQHRQPIYRAMAENWGITVQAADIAQVTTPEDFNRVIATALEKHTT
jgi:NAD(P)-dependent dehydrogenase (short-subunit alcohol dehydrogenase family)